jgi:hypothetical protein
LESDAAMLTENVRSGKIETFWSGVHDRDSERDALINLALAAWLSFLLWVLLLVRTFTLLVY